MRHQEKAALFPVVLDPVGFVSYYRRYWEIAVKEYKKPRAIAVRYVGLAEGDVAAVLRGRLKMTPARFEIEKSRLARAFPRAWEKTGAGMCATMGQYPGEDLEGMAERLTSVPVLAKHEAWRYWTPPQDRCGVGGAFFRLLFDLPQSPAEVAAKLHITTGALARLFHDQWVPRPETLVRKGWIETLPMLAGKTRWAVEGPFLLLFLEGKEKPACENKANPLRGAPRPARIREAERALKSGLVQEP